MPARTPVNEGGGSLLLRRMARIGAAAVSGALFHWVIGMRPWWPAAWIAPIPVLIAVLDAETDLEGSLLALAAGLLGVLPNFTDYATATRSAPLAAVYLALQALIPMFAMRDTRRMARKWNGPVAVFFYPMFMSGLSALVAELSPEGSRGNSAVSQADFPIALQIASVGGIASVVFLFSLFASTVACAIYFRREWAKASAPVAWRAAFAAAGFVLSASL